MKISHGTRIKNIHDSNGYGYATSMMLESLDRLGYQVDQNDPTADVEIWFDQPHHWKFSKGLYRIGYHPWESTKLKPGWAEIMNECDEIWTPSPLMAEWYREYNGIKAPIYVYEHGVEDIWTPVKRKIDGPLKFLHVGGEANRKGLRDTIHAYRQAFGRGDKGVELNLKLISDGWNMPWMNGINVMTQRISKQEMVRLFHLNHVFVYPSYGEGFGLSPLQAIATGMPTITVPAWAPYKQHLIEQIQLKASPVKTPWPQIHPGNMLKPSMDDLIHSMREVRENYELYEELQRAMVEDMKVWYDWDRLTEAAFGNLKKRLEK